MDIGGWLRGLGLAQYEAAFRDNEIDGEVLPNLTADDLKELGVAIVGHRRKLLTAIAELHASPVAPTPSTPAPSALAPAQSAHDGERRPITVMFCDLVGSTSLAARLDAEDWRNLVGGYLDEASRAVASLGGHVLKKLGDGLMALFGYPQAQENDGERAVRAALAIQGALADLNARNAVTGAPELAARIGLESGRVVVDSSGEVYGEAPNVAARVQSAAAPGEIWITRSVHRQIAGLFVAEDKGAHELKGVPEKTQLYRIVRVSGGGRRGGSRAPTPLIGRGEELDILARRWERARRGEGQLALIVGEPGLGKSRLIEEFRARLAETPHTWVEWTSSQLLQNTPLHPIAEWGRVRFGGAEVSGEKRLAELEAALASVGLDAAEYAPLLAPVIDAPLPPARVPKLSPEELRSRQLAALAAWVLAGAHTQPLVLAFEDLHWADPTSLDVLQALAERGAQAPLLIIATTRPEFRPPWKLRSHHGVISLAPLDAGEVVRMVGEIATRHALSKDVIAGVSERSGGVPLFIEEVTRLLLERGEQGGVQAIPPTLQQSLAARLDRLGSAREIAQIGAVLGRGFSYALLKSVAAVDDRGRTGVSDPGHSFLDAALEKLADAELLFVEGVAPQANYRFKHALIQDAAYDSLLKSRRQTLHRRAAEILLASPAPEAEALAHHFTLGGETELAIEWWGKAGDQALRRSAFAEAISHLGKAIELSDNVGGAAPRRDAAETASASQRLKLQTSYGRAVMWSKGFTADETKAAFARVGELATEIGDAEAALNAYFARWADNLWRGQLGLAREAAESFLREAERAVRPMEAAVAHRLLGLTLLNQGDFAGARAHCEQTLRIFNLERDSEAKFRFGQDPAIVATAYLSCTSWLLGDVEGARKHIEQATNNAVDSGHDPTLATVYNITAHLEIWRGDAASARTAAEASVAIGRERGLALWRAYAALSLAGARARVEMQGAALTDFRRAVTEYATGGYKFNLPFYRGLLAEIEIEDRGAEVALAEIDGALALAGETGEHWFDAALHRIRGEILLKQNPVDPAPSEAAFLAAIAVAQQQKARSFELRAALSLAKLYLSTGRPTDAYDVLGPALTGFSPTPEFPQIAEAKALFEALAADGSVMAAAASRERRVHLQVAYGNAMLQVRGYNAPEATAAFARARELAGEFGDALERIKGTYGIWVGNLTRGELEPTRETAKAMLRDVETRPRSMEASIALRINGTTSWYAGEFVRARAELEGALAISNPERDRELAYSFGQAPGVALATFLGLTLWPLGEIEPATKFADIAVAEAERCGHVPTILYAKFIRALFELVADRPTPALEGAEQVLRLARENDLPIWVDWGRLVSLLVQWRSRPRGEALAEARDHLDSLRARGLILFITLYEALLAEVEADSGDADGALERLDRVLAETERGGQHWFNAETHRIRGEILLKRNPADPAAAQAAFLAAIAVAQQQKARSFELRAALSLAKLYQSTGRPIDAHDVLGPALEGFSATPEFPQIAEAKALFEALAADEAVKVDAARRAQRLKLQTNYGHAVLWAKGYAADETKAAFARVRELATEISDSEASFEALYGRWGNALFRGELASARESAESFLREADRARRPTEAGVGHRLLGITLFLEGDFARAGANCEQALLLYDPDRDRDAKFRLGMDSAVVATGFLALAAWCLGDVAHARVLMDEALARASGSAHAPTLANAFHMQATLETIRDDAEAARRAAETGVALSRQHGLALYLALETLALAWARAKLDDRGSGSAEFRRALSEYASQGVVFEVPLYDALLAEIENERGGTEAALAEIDGALALAGETGEHWFDAGLHRIRGEILIKQNPADPASAEDAFLAAIAVAQQQRARSFELRAALSLAKLYQSTGRPIDAHDVLGPALEGFSATPEFPQIAEAKALFEALAQTNDVKIASASRVRQVQLQIALGNALIASRGHGAPETTAAFAKARELAKGIDDAGTRASITYGLWVGSYYRAELESMRELADGFLRDAEAKPDSPEAGVAHRINGVTRWFQGDFVDARKHYEQALAIFDQKRDRELAFRFGQDQFVATEILLALVLWPLGEVAEAARLAEAALRHAEEGGQIITIAYLHMWAGALEILREDVGRVRSHVDALVKVSREHNLATFIEAGAIYRGWIDWRGGACVGADQIRQGLKRLREQLGSGLRMAAFEIALAEQEAANSGRDAAVSILDNVLAESARTGQRWLESEDRRARGEILARFDLVDPAAEAAFLAAIAVAQQQKARSFELRAALSLAKLYQSTGRPIDAHDVLGPALAGFAPTPEFPQIAEAKVLFEALAQPDGRL